MKLKPMELNTRELELINQAVDFYRKEVSKDDKEYFRLGFRLGCELAGRKKLREYGLIDTPYDELMLKARRINEIKK